MSNEYRQYVTITRSELNRYNQQTRQITDLNRQIEAERRRQNALRSENDSYRVQLSGLTSEMNNVSERISQLQTENTQLQNQISSTVSNMNTRLSEINRRHRADIAQMNREYEDNIRSVRNELNSTADELRSVIDRERRNTEARIHNLENDLRAEISGLQTNLNAVEQTVRSIRDDDSYYRSLAQTYQSNISILIDELNGYRTEQFFPGRIRRLTETANNLNDDLSSGRFGIGATAHSAARELFNDVLRLRQDVLIEEQRWDYRQQLLNQVLDRVEDQINASATILLEGEEDPVDVDYWTYGAISSLRSRLNEIKEQSNNRDLTISQLEDLEAAAVQINSETIEAGSFATLAFRASQLRHDMIERLENRLSEGPYSLIMELDGDAYEGDDDRGGIRALFRNEVSDLDFAITIKPRYDGESVNAEVLYDVVSNGVHTPAFQDSIRDNVLAVLNEMGLHTTPPIRLHTDDELCTDEATRFDVEVYSNQKPVEVTPYTITSNDTTQNNTGNSTSTRNNTRINTSSRNNTGGGTLVRSES